MIIVLDLANALNPSLVLFSHLCDIFAGVTLSNRQSDEETPSGEGTIYLTIVPNIFHRRDSYVEPFSCDFFGFCRDYSAVNSLLLRHLDFVSPLHLPRFPRCGQSCRRS